MRSNKAENLKSASDVIIDTPKITSDQPEKILEKAGIRVLSATPGGSHRFCGARIMLLAISRNREFYIQDNGGVSYEKLLMNVGPEIADVVNKHGRKNPKKFTLTEIRHAIAGAAHNAHYNRKVPE